MANEQQDSCTDPVLPSSERRYTLRSAALVVSACYAIVGGSVTISGWALNEPRLTDWGNTGISMFPNAALCAILSGIALLLIDRAPGRLRYRTASRALALLVAVLGGVTLIQHLFGLNFGIDTLLITRTWGQRAAAGPMRMGPPASFSYLALGLGLLLATGGPRARRLAATVALLPVAVSSFSLFGYLFGADQLYTIVYLTAIALQTSSMIAVLGIGLMAAVPEHGTVALLRRDDPGGMLVRRLLLPIIVIPLFLGWLRLLGEHAGLYDTAFGLSAMSLINIAMLLALLAWTAIGIGDAAVATRESRDQLEAVLKKDISERMRTEQALREREERYELVLVGTEAAIWDWDVRHRRVLYAPRWKQLRGLSETEVSDSEEEWSKGIHPDDYPRVKAALRAHFNGDTPVFSEEYRVQHRDGRWLWILDRGIARRDESGRVVRMAGSETDITERKQLEEQLHQRVAELAESDRRKNEFLATLAHELRNPLAPIRNALQYWRLAGRGSEGEFQEILERQVDHMVRLVDDLLEVSRINRGQIDLRLERVSVASVLHNAIETSQPLIEAGEHQFTVELPEDSLFVVGDPVRLSQVVANLLNNAAKYTEPGGKISLAAMRRGAEVSISVRDTGIGISSDMLPQLFRMFSQAAKDHKRSQGGLGIGLALVKSLVELHGGRVEARSEGEGRGSEFIVSLPLAEPQHAPLADTAPSSSAARRSHSSRVLVVDDNHDAAFSLATLLHVLGHDVHAAYDGPEALKAIQEFKPAVVLLDLGMPGMSGYEVAQQVRAMPVGRDIVLVAVTGWGQEEDRRRSKAAGFNHHLVKPVEVEELTTLFSKIQHASHAS